MGDDPKGFLDTHSDVALELDYPEYIYENLRPIFVSRMPNHKVTGAAHADTIRSPRHFKDEGIVLTKTALTDLKLDKHGEIDGYYNPQSDLLLYEALKNSCCYMEMMQKRHLHRIFINRKRTVQKVR